MNPPQPPHLRLSHPWTFGLLPGSQPQGQGQGLAPGQGQIGPGIPLYYDNPRAVSAQGQGLAPGSYYPPGASFQGQGLGPGLGYPSPYIVPYGSPISHNMAAGGGPAPDVPFQWEPSDHYAHPWADSQVEDDG